MGEKKRRMEAARRTRPRVSLGFFVSIFLVVSVIFVLWFRSVQEKEKRPTSIPRVPVLSETPPSKSLPKSGKEIGDPRRVIRTLVLTHPHPDVREEMNETVETGQLVWVQTDDGKMLNPNAIMSFVIVHGEDGAPIRAMEFDGKQILDPNTPKELLQLVLLHEFQHYRQSFSKLLFAPMFVQTAGSFARLTEADVRQMFLHEMEAYRIECDFAIEQDWTRFVSFCETYRMNGYVGLWQSLAQTLATVMPWQIHAPILGRLAKERPIRQ